MKYQIPKQLMASFHDDGFRVAYNATDENLDIWLHGAVGDEFNSTDSLSIGQLLSSHSGKPISLRVNSPGGLAYDGVAIYNAIKSHSGPTTGIIEGLAGSAASLAVIACDTVQSYPQGAFHPHYSLVLAMGHQAEIRDALAIQEMLDQDLEKMYSDESGQTLKQVQEDLIGPNGDGTRFTAQQAMDAGYVTEIIGNGGKAGKQAATVSQMPHMMQLRAKRLDMISRLG